MRKTKLMELAYSYGDQNGLISSTIDPVLYKLAELAESAFGPIVIDQTSNYLALSNSGVSQAESLRFLVERFFTQHVLKRYYAVGKDEAVTKLKALPKLTDQSYVEYFMITSVLERHAFRTEIEKAASKFSQILSSYQVESAFPICEGMVEFFRLMDDQTGMVELLMDLSRHLKQNAPKRSVRPGPRGIATT